MFTGKNSQTSMVSDEKNESIEESLKMYVTELDKDRTDYFRNTLRELVELRDMSIELKKEYSVVIQNLSKAIDTHERVVSELHDHLCKKLALLGYNEFKHQVFVEPDGKVYIVPQDTLITKEDVAP